ncbi:hypothetical protein LP417_15580 [Polaromonas sp. P1-6]|nr:hypothetical protein LP417_15580 [Polaromonas sp. P1-6]
MVALNWRLITRISVPIFLTFIQTALRGAAMTRCCSNTKTGRRCFNHAKPGSDFCNVHASQLSLGEVLATGAGALIGNVLIPGIGGVIAGGWAGRSIRNLFKENDMAKKRVFVSFDFDNDRVLKDFILGQAKLPDSPFEVIDHSLKEAAPERDWERKARIAIGKAEIVLVMVGAQTYKAHGVLKEVSMAREAGVRIVQLIGYKDGDYTPVPNAGRLYSWNWDNLKKLLS